MAQLHIFDIDGTVLDSMRMWDELVPEYLRFKGIDPPEGIAEIIDPLTVPQVFEYVADRFPAAGDTGTVRKELTERIKQQYAENVSLFGDAAEELKKIKAEGERIIAFSNTPHEFIDFAIKQNKLDVYFSAIFTVEDVGERKDSARAFTKLCERLQIMPEEATVHDDSAFALEAAKAAGCRVEVYDRYRGGKDRGRKGK